MSIQTSHLKICLRGGSFKLLMYAGFFSILLAVMVSVYAGRQQQTLLVDFAFSTIRISMCLAVLLWIQETFVKTLDTKTVVQYLAFPSPRYAHILSIFIAVAVIMFAATVVFSVSTLLVVKVTSGFQISTPVNFGAAYWLMWLFMWVDILIVAGFCIFIATLSKTPYLAIVVAFGFYIAGHSIQQMLDLLNIADYIDGRTFFQSFLGVIKFLVPDLSVFDIRHWSLYSEVIEWSAVGLKSLAAICYLALTLSLGTLFFSRREIV